jgi:hypothetical protein
VASENTNCFSYKVELVIQVLAKDETAAREQLDKEGGYVSSRNVTLMDSIPLYSGETNETN